MMSRLSISLLFLVSFLLNVNAQVTFFVSPQGSDESIGSKEAPLASLVGARNAIRAYKADHGGKTAFTVLIEDGVYWMKESLELYPEDSGMEDYPIIYKAVEGASPVFSGGKKISGFKLNDNGVWEVEIPESKYYKWRFDQLYVDDNKATLARTPNIGFLKIGDVKETIWEKGTGRVALKAQQILQFDEQNFASLESMEDEDLEYLRFRAFHKWDFTIRQVDQVDKDSLSITTSGKGMKPWNPLKKDGRVILENYKAALDAPGEWFLSKKGVLSYIPFPGQNIENTEFIAPVLDHLMIINGVVGQNEFVEYVTFEGITFKHSHYKMPPHGFEPNQAATAITSSIILEGARHISFLNCEISYVGQHALWFGKACSHGVVRQCHIHHIGGGGIYLGDKDALEGAEHTHHITLENNIIQTGGQEFPPAVGVWVGHSSDNLITHNDIGNFYYSGISVGWIWGYNPSLAKRNTITYNHIHHIGWDLLSDMAAVYSLGKSEGTVISNNVVHHVHAYSYGGWGLYTDEGSSDIIMENNLVYSTKTGGFHQHYGANNIIRNNIFAYAKLYQAQCTRVEDHLSFDFSNNIIVFDEGVVLRGAWKNIKIKMDQNLYWNTAGGQYDFSGSSFSEWQKSGHDMNSRCSSF